MRTTCHFGENLGCAYCRARIQGMFCDFAPESFPYFQRIGRLVTVPKGHIVMREGEAGDRVIIICRGRVLLSCISREGKRLNLLMAMPGEVCGLFELVSNRTFEATAETMVESQLKVVDREELQHFIDAYPDVGKKVMQALAASCEVMFDAFVNLSFSGSVASRIANLFLQWGQPDDDGGDQRRFTLNLTQDDLASFAATTRETVSRVLGRFQKSNLIRIEGESVRILAPKELEKLIA